jgi:hypothetical protein
MTDFPADRHLRRVLADDEHVQLRTAAVDAWLTITDRRVAVVADHGVTLDVTFDRLRRVQFDIERHRPATLVIVPESPSDVPQVLAIPPEQYDTAAQALAIIGLRLATTPDATDRSGEPEGDTGPSSP